jgi:hypothetical protein
MLEKLMRMLCRLLAVGLLTAFLVGCTEDATKPAPGKEKAPAVNNEKGTKDKPMTSPPPPPVAPNPKG